VEVKEDGHRTGMVVEFDRTQTIFTNPADERTEAYVTGRFG
jgi:phosphate transport system ATP-binding protein